MYKRIIPSPSKIIRQVGNYTLKMHMANLVRDIEQAKEFGLKLNVFIVGNKCCSECEKIDDLKFPLEEILQNPVLPYPKCLRKPFCNCCYRFEPIRDENNKLIKTQS